MKQCSKCGGLKPLKGFYKNKNIKDGRMNKCRDCCKQYYEDNKQAYLEYHNHYYQDNKETIVKW